MNRAQSVICVAAALVAAVAVAMLHLAPADRSVVARFWFDDVTYALPGFGATLGAPLSDAEYEMIEAVARTQLAHAFARFGIRFTEDDDARYRVRVMQRFQPRSGPRRFAVAESVSMGAFGGDGSISFEAVASRAIGNAPPNAGRTEIIDGIGRGLGRVAAHEFAHQLLHAVNLHASQDTQSYEYRGANRIELFYGPMHWAFAGPLLLERLGARSATAASGV